MVVRSRDFSVTSDPNIRGFPVTSAPEVFDRYLISSPSVWYDDEAILPVEEQYAKKHAHLPARVVLPVRLLLAWMLALIGVLCEPSRYFRSTIERKRTDMSRRRRLCVRSRDSLRARFEPAWLLFLCLCILPQGGCQDSGLSVGDIQARGFLRAGYSEEPPYAFRDSAGNIRGESPQALELAAEALQVEDIRWVRLDFRDLIPALQNGRVDVLAAGMYRTPERADRVLFTRPTVCSGPALVVRAGSGTALDLDAVVDGTTRFAVLAGSVEQVALERLSVPAPHILIAPDVRTAVTAVIEEKVDALAITEPTARWLTRQSGNHELEVVTYEPPARVQGLLEACAALAFRPEDEELSASVDSVLARVLESPRRREMLEFLGFSQRTAAPAGRPEGER